MLPRWFPDWTKFTVATVPVAITNADPLTDLACESDDSIDRLPVLASMTPSRERPPCRSYCIVGRRVKDDCLMRTEYAGDLNAIAVRRGENLLPSGCESEVPAGFGFSERC